MPKQRCPGCGSMMKTMSKGTADHSTWEKDSRRRNNLGYQRWHKLTMPSTYQIVMKCPNGSCRKLMTYGGPSMSFVHGYLNRRYNRERCEQITRDAEDRRREEAIEQKRREQDAERRASKEG